MIGIFVLILVVWGTISFIKLPLDAVPDITNNQVQVITQAPTLGTQEVEAFITAPIERALANIPKVTERRSISRSGLSVITIVFHDDQDIYWARQMVGERLKEAEEEIPETLAKPFMAPITTGLGEIYHYTIHTKPGFEDKYSATELRTIQDWVVKRQLEGTPGVAEVSGWGGFVKQYEIAVDPDKLNALNLTMNDVFEALEHNNENTGGSYIEKGSNLYYIRGIGLVQTLQDIEKIVVTNRHGIPVLIRNVGTVQYGSVNRLGAVTRNGEGETVAGITLMLKGEDFNQVIATVKDRIKVIQSSLPDGVVIEPFIDRTELVNRTIGTVEKNLVEGGLIVIFVLIIMLGNLRAGLIVASVIPLSMLFAFGMMRLFNVSGNLMSLGAIDFGLIVDGAVIIVESVIFGIVANRHSFMNTDKLTQIQMDGQVQLSASKMMNSAAFGQLIILIVYLPILSLVGIEGKMFRPMAQTVAFAILGAFLLSLTWIPMASAMFLQKNIDHKSTFGDKIMNFFHKIYSPSLNKAMKNRKLTVGVALLLFGLALVGFTRLGGEFIPTLEEGDLTVEFSMMQGTSLTRMIESTTKAEKILLDNFPEVKQVVSRIGSAEIPTDPMPVERGDVMVSMKPKSTWREEVCNREEMQEAMEDALSALPGVSIEMTQPMQMRFNELMTGIRQDVAIKIFGDDLEVLATEASKVAGMIKSVRGVNEPIVEKVKGLPQIQVIYDRDRLSQFGLNISEVNTIVRTAYAGNVAGVVFEGEKRFDLVVRLERSLREDITNLENLYVSTPNGNRIPLSQIATIEYKDAPAQVSRESGQRRIYVGFNVRGRDVESTVEEIEKILSENLKLPPGYYYTFGGQFQNLREAKERLSIAVPVALCLILALLFFAFRSVSQAFLIFTAVPLSAIGGVAALIIRGMPFSISAGVGFIALFGVAVLNGIVLIASFNQLKRDGILDISDRVRKGTYSRLRPVLMTAAVASLGFLPMALSTGDGAEVQRPLATVVIGGLISATLLTLLVLPVLYIWFEKWFGPKTQPKRSLAMLIPFLCLLIPQESNSQIISSVNQAIEIAQKNNPQLKQGIYQIQVEETLRKAAYEYPKTSFDVELGQYNSNSFDNSFGITQIFPNHSNKKAGIRLADAKIQEANIAYTVSENDLKYKVRSLWNELLFLNEKRRTLQGQDSLFTDFVRAAEVRFRVDETGSLEQATAISQSGSVKNQLRQVEIDITIAKLELRTWLATKDSISIPEETKIETLSLSDSMSVLDNPVIGFYNQQIALRDADISVQKALRSPDFKIGYVNQSLITSEENVVPSYDAGDRFHVIQGGIEIPLFGKAYKAKIDASMMEMNIAQLQADYQITLLQNEYMVAQQNYAKHLSTIEYYENSSQSNANLLLHNAQLAFKSGDINYVEYLQAVTIANQMRLDYLEAITQFNQTVLRIEWLVGK